MAVAEWVAAGLAAGLIAEAAAVVVVAEGGVAGDCLSREIDVVGNAVAAGKESIACLWVETVVEAVDTAPDLQFHHFPQKTSYVGVAQAVESGLQVTEVAVARAAGRTEQETGFGAAVELVGIIVRKIGIDAVVAAVPAAADTVE